MNIQFSIIGLAIVVVFYLLCAGVLVLVGLQIKDKKWRGFIIAPLVLATLALPWIDEVLTARNFKEICRNAGARITRKIVVEGFFDRTGGYSASLASSGLVTDPGVILDFDRSGYRYKERLLTDGRIQRLERVAEGVRASVLDRSKARYHFIRPIHDADAGRSAECSEDIILDSETQETVARYRYCKRYASLPERVWLGLVHRGPIEYCPEGNKKLRGLLYEEVLMPAKKP